MTHIEACVPVHLPILQQDIVGVVASFLDVFDLRRSFIRVCKLWFETGTDIVKSIWISHLVRFLQSSTIIHLF